MSFTGAGRVKYFIRIGRTSAIDPTSSERIAEPTIIVSLLHEAYYQMEELENET